MKNQRKSRKSPGEGCVLHPLHNFQPFFSTLKLNKILGLLVMFHCCLGECRGLLASSIRTSRHVDFLGRKLLADASSPNSTHHIITPIQTLLKFNKKKILLFLLSRFHNSSKKLAKCKQVSLHFHHS